MCAARSRDTWSMRAAMSRSTVWLVSTSMRAVRGLAACSSDAPSFLIAASWLAVARSDSRVAAAYARRADASRSSAAATRDAETPALPRSSSSLDSSTRTFPAASSSLLRAASTRFDAFSTSSADERAEARVADSIVRNPRR